MRSWSPAHFRATLQGYFLPASAVGMCGYWAAGLWTVEVTGYFAWSLAPMALAIVLGRLANRRLSLGAFIRLVHVGLIGIGLLLLGQSLG
jgi:hypothetical protein